VELFFLLAVKRQQKHCVLLQAITGKNTH